MTNSDTFHTIIGVLFVLVIFFTTLFSSIILLVLICNWRTKCRSILNLLTINSCVTFLLLMLASSSQIPLLFSRDEQLTHNPYAISCRIRGFFFLFACLSKNTSHFIQAVSRYFTVVRYKHRFLLTYRTNSILIIFSWLFSLSISTGMFISPISYQYEPESRFCLLTTKIFVTSYTLAMIGFSIPGSIMVCLYSAILKHITHPNRVQPTNFNTIRNNKRDAKVFRNTLLLLILANFGGIPYFVSIIANKVSKTPTTFYSFVILCLALSGVAETLAIFCLNKDVKTILYAKFGFLRPREMAAVWNVPTPKPWVHPLRANVASSRTMTK